VPSTDAPAATEEVVATTQAPAVDLPDVVVTHSVLGAVVRELVEGVAEVVVLIPDGQDPHDFEPSAKNIEAINEAAVVVANGLGLEEGLDASLRKAATTGTPVFYVADHVTVLDVVDVNDHSSHGHIHSGAQSDHAHDDHDHSEDPHVWLSPATMREAIPALSAALNAALAADVSNASEQFLKELDQLDAELTTLFDGISDCQLVTGHNELGYFAARYGCTVIAAILSSPSTTAEESAGNIEFVISVIASHGARAVFTSLGTNRDVARQLADAAGVPLVEISTHYLGPSTGYVDFVRALGTTIASNLS
jgi:zinc/manganese transport system substrate-binding protein